MIKLIGLIGKINKLSKLQKKSMKSVKADRPARAGDGVAYSVRYKYSNPDPPTRVQG